MLNIPQSEQFKAFLLAVNEGKPANVSGELVDHYFSKCVDDKTFVNNAAKFLADRKNNVVAESILMLDPIHFYKENRIAITQWLDGYVKHQSSGADAVLFIKEIMNKSCAKFAGGLVTDNLYAEMGVDTIASVLYGSYIATSSYNNAAKFIAMMVVENMAQLFMAVNFGDQNLPPTTAHYEDQVTAFIENIGDSGCSEVGSELARAFIDDVGHLRFAEKAQNYYHLPTSESPAYHKQPVSFFYNHHSLVLGWINNLIEQRANDYQHNAPSVKVIDEDSTVLGHVQAVAEYAGLKVNIDDIAKIIYGNDLDNPHYQPVAKAMIDSLAVLLSENL